MANLRTWFVLVLVGVVAFGDLGGVAAQDEGGVSPAVGRFERFGMDGTLTEDDVAATAGGIRVESPVFASELRVSADYLRGRLGDWAASRPFELDSNGNAVLPGEDTEFAAFVPSEAPAFTMGSLDSIRLTSRPMWVSAAENADGSIRLDFDDGDTAGQAVYVAKEWLRGRGIHRPIATHEDGAILDVAQSGDNEGFVIQMPHFSWVILTAADIDVKERANGVTSPHADVKRWDAANRTLEVDVGPRLSDVEILIEKDWVDANISHPALEDGAYLLTHGWVLEHISGTWYYNIGVDNRGILTTLRMMEFRADATRVYSAGSPMNLNLHGIPTLVVVQAIGPGNLSLTLDLVQSSTPVSMNATWLSSKGVTKALLENETGDLLSVSVSGGRLQSVLPNPRWPDPTTIVLGILDSLLPDDDMVRGEGADATKTTCLQGVSPNMEHLYDYADDFSGNTLSSASLYVLDGKFCWEWSLHPGQVIVNDNLRWYQVFGGVYDPDFTDHNCFTPDISTEEDISSQGYAICNWPSDVVVPDSIVATFSGKSVSKSEYEVDYGDDEFYDCVTDAPVLPRVVEGRFPVSLILKRTIVGLAAACAVYWAVRGEAFFFEDPDSGRRYENIITDSPVVDTTSWVDVSIFDLNYQRDDSWDFLEDPANGPIWHSLYSRGPQTLGWDVKRVSNAVLYYTADHSSIKSVDSGTADNQNYKVQVQDGPNLQLNAKAARTTFSYPPVAITAVDWEVPDAIALLFSQRWFEVLRVPAPPTVPTPEDPYISFGSTGPLGVPVLPSDLWLTFDFIGSSLDSAEFLLSPGTTSTLTLAELQSAGGSTLQALARKVTSNATFSDGELTVENPGTPAPDGGNLIEPYHGVFRASSEGSSTVSRIYDHESDVEEKTLEIYFDYLGIWACPDCWLPGNP